MEHPLLGWFGPLVPGGGLERVVDGGTVVWPPATFPAFAGQWEASYSSPAPSAIWTFQESAAPVIDQVAANNLDVVVGTPDFGQAGEGGRLAVLFDGTESLQVSDDAFLQASEGTSISLWLRAFVPDVDGNGVLAGTTFVAGTGWRINQLTISTDRRVQCNVDDGPNSAQAYPIDSYGGAWHNFVAILDRDADLVRLETDLVTDDGDLSGVGDATALPFGFSGLAGTLIGYAAAWYGYVLTPGETAELAAVTP